MLLRGLKNEMCLNFFFVIIMAVLTPSVYYDGPEQEKMYWLGEARKVFTFVNNNLLQDLKHRRYIKNYRSGASIEVLSVVNEGRMDIIRINVPKPIQARRLPEMIRKIREPVPVFVLAAGTITYPDGGYFNDSTEPFYGYLVAPAFSPAYFQLNKEGTPYQTTPVEEHIHRKTIQKGDNPDRMVEIENLDEIGESDVLTWEGTQARTGSGGGFQPGLEGLDPPGWAFNMAESQNLLTCDWAENIMMLHPAGQWSGWLPELHRWAAWWWSRNTNTEEVYRYPQDGAQTFNGSLVDTTTSVIKFNGNTLHSGSSVQTYTLYEYLNGFACDAYWTNDITVKAQDVSLMGSSVVRNASDKGYTDDSVYMYIYATEEFSGSEQHGGPGQTFVGDGSTDTPGMYITTNARYTYYVNTVDTEGSVEFVIHEVYEAEGDVGIYVTTCDIYDFHGRPVFVYGFKRYNDNKMVYGMIYRGKHTQSDAYPVVGDRNPDDDFHHVITDSSHGGYGWGKIKAAGMLTITEGAGMIQNTDGVPQEL